MTAWEVIVETARLIGDKELETIIDKSQAGESLTAEENKKLKRYISGLNIAVDTIASRYYMNLREIKVTSSSDARVEYSELDDRVYEIVNVHDESGVAVEFYSLPFSLYLPKRNTRYLVKFKFLPRRVEEVSDEVMILPFVPITAICYLMVSDIMLAKNLYDESRFWFSKFESCINKAVSSRRMRTLCVSKLV